MLVLVLLVVLQLVEYHGKIVTCLIVSRIVPQGLLVLLGSNLKRVTQVIHQSTVVLYKSLVGFFRLIGSCCRETDLGIIVYSCNHLVLGNLILNVLIVLEQQVCTAVVVGHAVFRFHIQSSAVWFYGLVIKAVGMETVGALHMFAEALEKRRTACYKRYSGVKRKN